MATAWADRYRLPMKYKLTALCIERSTQHSRNYKGTLNLWKGNRLYFSINYIFMQLHHRQFLLKGTNLQQGKSWRMHTITKFQKGTFIFKRAPSQFYRTGLIEEADCDFRSESFLVISLRWWSFHCRICLDSSCMSATWVKSCARTLSWEESCLLV